MITNNNPHLLDKYTKNSPCVIFFHMDGCHHCEGVKKIWPSFTLKCAMQCPNIKSCLPPVSNQD